MLVRSRVCYRRPFADCVVWSPAYPATFCFQFEVLMAIKVSTQSIRSPLALKVREISGQDPNMCFQCGLCAGTCPMTGEMEVYTRKVMHMLQLGLVDSIISQRMAYLCASCHTCEVRCPRGLDIPKIVEALRQISLRKGENFLAPESIPADKVKQLPQVAMVAGFRKFTG